MFTCVFVCVCVCVCVCILTFAFILSRLSTFCIEYYDSALNNASVFNTRKYVAMYYEK